MPREKLQNLVWRPWTSSYKFQLYFVYLMTPTFILSFFFFFFLNMIFSFRYQPWIHKHAVTPQDQCSVCSPSHLLWTCSSFFLSLFATNTTSHWDNVKLNNKTTANDYPHRTVTKYKTGKIQAAGKEIPCLCTHTSFTSALAPVGTAYENKGLTTFQRCTSSLYRRHFEFKNVSIVYDCGLK